MRAGRLDHEITIERANTAIDDSGTPVTSWTPLVTARADLIQQSTEEFIRGFGASDETVVIFRAYWVPDLTTADRVIFNGRPFNIKELKEIGRRKSVEIRCVERNPS